MKVHGFVIHLARAAQRRPQVELLRGMLPVSSDVIDAVDGQKLTQADIDACYRPFLHRPRYPFAIGKGEIGCFLSHRRAWEEIVRRDLDAGLIFEDDVEIDRAIFPEALALAMETLKPGDFVRFPWRGHTDPGRSVAAKGAVVVREPSYPGVGMLGQLVGRQAAEALIEATRMFDRPVDSYIQARWLHGQRVLAVNPVALKNRDRDIGGTTLTVKTKKSLGVAVGREISRIFYRSNVRIRNYIYGYNS